MDRAVFNDASGSIDADYDASGMYNNVRIKMCFIVPEAGDVIQCLNDTDGSGNPKMVYRLNDDNSIRHYPNPPVASS